MLFSMKVFKKILVMFASSNDEDLAAEENFQVSFSNVVNFLLLVYSLISGLHALLIENIGMAVSNMAFSLLFLLYFLSHYLTKRSLIVTAIDRMVIFSQFIVAYMNGSALGSAGVTLLVYPFIAIILHGRRFGVALSIIQIFICAAYTALCRYGVLPIPFMYSNIELFILASIQAVCIFVYYVAIRWLSSLIYDRITEVSQLNEALGIKTELVNTVTGKLKSQLNEIYNMSEKLSHERMNPRQVEMVATLRAVASNLLDSVEMVSTSSEHNIRPIEKEEIEVNVFNLISNVLVLYSKQSDNGGNIHSVNVSASVPQHILGNSQLTRQIFLTSFDALDRKFDLSKTPLKVSVSMNDVTTERMMLNFIISSKKSIELDRRDLTSSESKLLYQLQLDATQRLVKAAGGEFYVEITDEDSLVIDFTLPFRDTILKNDDNENITNLINIAALATPINVEDMRILLVEDNIEICDDIREILQGKVKSITIVDNGKAALKKFENSHFDCILVDVDTAEVDGVTFIRKARDVESGYGAGVPIFALTGKDNKDIERNTSIKIDGVISKPFDTRNILDIIKDAINCNQA